MSGIPVPSTLFTYGRRVGTNPAAGSEVNDSVPAGKYWWLLSATVQLVQGATQTPLPVLVIDDGANIIFESAGSTAAQGASTTAQYTWAQMLPLTGQIGTTPNIVSTGALAEYLILPAGYRIRTVTGGIGANTDYGAPSYYVVEFG